MKIENFKVFTGAETALDHAVFTSTAALNSSHLQLYPEPSYQEISALL